MQFQISREDGCRPEVLNSQQASKGVLLVQGHQLVSTLAVQLRDDPRAFELCTAPLVLSRESDFLGLKVGLPKNSCSAQAVMVKKQTAGTETSVVEGHTSAGF